MFLRLRYYFKTDRKIRVQDKQEYADQRKKLKNLDDILEYRCEEITFPFEDLIIVNLLGRDKNILDKSNLFVIFGAIVCANA